MAIIAIAYSYTTYLTGSLPRPEAYMRQPNDRCPSWGGRLPLRPPIDDLAVKYYHRSSISGHTMLKVNGTVWQPLYSSIGLRLWHVINAAIRRRVSAHSVAQTQPTTNFGP